MTTREFFSKLGRFLSYPFKKIIKWATRFVNLFKKPIAKSKPSLETQLPDTIIDIPKTVFSPIKVLPRDAEVDKNGMTPLMRAVLANDMDAVKKLLTQPININQDNRKVHNVADTALGLAVQNANVEMVALLLEHGASIELGQFFKIYKEENEKNLARASYISTRSVLDFFPSPSSIPELSSSDYESRKTEIFKLIANKGKGDIIITQPNPFYITMLATGHLPTLKATIDFMRKHQLLSYDMSRQNEHFDFINFYRPPLSLNLSSYTYSSLYQKKPLWRSHCDHDAVSFAMANNQEETALFLLKNRIEDLRAADNWEEKTFIFAIYYNQESVIKFCLERLTVDRISECFDLNTGFTALMAAAYVGNIALIKELLDSGVDINHQNHWRFYTDTERNYTALYSAIQSDKNLENKQEIITILLNNGAKLNVATLDKIVTSGFKLNLENVTQYIELFDEKEYDPAPYAEIIEQIKQHNEKVQSKTLKALEEALPQAPKVITHLISEYSSLKPIIKTPDSSDSETAKPKKPKS